MDSKYDHKIHEQTIQHYWQEKQIYHLQVNSVDDLYTIDTPPPTVSGNLHIGHIFSYTQTDSIARYQRLNGLSVFYPFGFDDNGLPTERYVEKKRNVHSYQMGRSAFITLCLEEVHLAAQEFTALWQRMGLSAYWDQTYSTIGHAARKISQESFIRLYEQGYVYRKKEPALYCTTCRTSVAQAELDDVEHDSVFYTLIFKDHYGNDLLIGTTRPELLSSCVALFYHPEDARYRHLKGQEAIVPLFGNTVPIYEDIRVQPEKGSGLVMCCTFGDSTDIAWYKDFNLPYKPSIDLDGTWMPHTGILAGKKRKDARSAVIDALKRHNAVVNSTPIKHTVNTHERCKQEIEYILIEQWFLNVKDHKKIFVDLADQIEWFPAFMKTRYIDWVENISWDWCLSRQRYFGIPFPAWHCKQCKHIAVAPLDMLPIDPQEVACPQSCSQCGNTDFSPDTDVMDTWNTSSLTPYLCQDLYQQITKSKEATPFIASNTFIPMSMRPQAHDIIRTWAFYTIVKTWFHHQTVPWKHVVISGHVISSDKEKLSKSKEQKALSPTHLLETYPADAIRYWALSSTLGYDTPFSDTQIKNGQRLLTKLWNAFRFLKDHAAASATFQPDGMINEWLTHHASLCFTQYQEYFARHEFSLALATIEKFFWHTFCDNYLELIKNQLFQPQEYDPALVKATKNTLYHVGLRILQMYAPFIPHITDTLYQSLYQEFIGIPSLHNTHFKNIQQSHIFEQSAHIIDTIVIIASKVRKLKTAQQLSLKTEIEELICTIDNVDMLQQLQSQDRLLRGITQARIIVYTTNTLQEDIIEKKDSLWYAQVTLT